METWAGVVVSLVGAAISLVGLEYAGGAEGRRQRIVLSYLEIGERLGETPAGREALEVARRETAELLEVRGTRLKSVLGFIGAILAAGVAIFCLVIGIGNAVMAIRGAPAQWIFVAASVPVVVIYGLMSHSALRWSMKALEQRKRQRPRVLLAGMGTDAGGMP